MAAVPIWKDVFVTLGTGDSTQYRITIPDTGDVIYSGKAFKRPGETNIYARINDVCADYIENVLPTLSQAEFTRITLPVTFKVQLKQGTQWGDITTAQFINDWSYDYGYDAATMGMSFPINGHIDARMPIVWTGLNVSEVTATITFKDGTIAQVIIAVAISNDFNADFNADFSRSVRSAGSGTAVFLRMPGIMLPRSPWEIPHGRLSPIVRNMHSIMSMPMVVGTPSSLRGIPWRQTPSRGTPGRWSMITGTFRTEGLTTMLTRSLKDSHYTPGGCLETKVR